MPILQPGQTSIELPSNKDGSLSSYVWPGGYPLYYVAHEEYKDGALYCVCATCANDPTERDTVRRFIIGYDVNWEDADMYCDVCCNRIESAYGEE